MKSITTLALVPVFLLVFSGTASAQALCETDSDCAAGFRCEEVGLIGCAEPACPPGDPCPEPEPCEEETFSMCVPGPCDSDAECAAGLRCYAVTSYDCADVPLCDEEFGPCDGERPYEDCDAETQGYCLPPYFAPCRVDSDCGPGFTCEATELCRCEGSSPDDSDPPDCVCEPGESYCQIVITECETDAACPEEWSCEEAGGVGTCSYDPSTGEEICEELPGTQVCVPPYFWEVGWGAWSDAETNPLDAATGGEASRVTGEIPRTEPSRSGCSAAPAPAGAGFPLLALAALAVLAARRRG